MRNFTGMAIAHQIRYRIRIAAAIAALFSLLSGPGCSKKPDPATVIVIIENSPTNLDPRVGLDAQSERIGELLFDSLVRRDERFQLQPFLADSWEIADPQ